MSFKISLRSKRIKLAISLGLPRLGFVALMKVNEYCKEHYVDFDEKNFASILICILEKVAIAEQTANGATTFTITKV